MTARRPIFLGLMAIYALAVGTGIVSVFYGGAGAPGGTFAFLSTLPWSLALVCLKGQGEAPRLVIAALYAIGAFLNVGIVALVFRPFRRD